MLFGIEALRDKLDPYKGVHDLSTSESLSYIGVLCPNLFLPLLAMLVVDYFVISKLPYNLLPLVSDI